MLRRSGIEPEKSRRRLEFDKLVIDMDAFELTVDGKKVPTPPKEMELLYHLASTPNRVYTRNQLLDEVWGFDYFRRYAHGRRAHQAPAREARGRFRISGT